MEEIDNYLNTSQSLWQYYRDKQAANGSGVIFDFKYVNLTDLFNFKLKNKAQRNEMTKKI